MIKNSFLDNKVRYLSVELRNRAYESNLLAERVQQITRAAS